MVLRPSHVTAGDKLLQIAAFLITGKLGLVKLTDVTQQRYLRVRQFLGQFHCLRFHSWDIASMVRTATEARVRAAW